ncbi:flagellar hook-basal body complex protein FliE [Leptospira harrisiae]|uniref:Flagellar hook-basal body complex protein FliE n=1 Tax=Leptospira harrisiae TaxID=2023189 RepID=A0A2N0ALM1_9LEPT|nr:flagellar hook-basal body complex protein FliE [Leptospira harrisiae]PJZ85180.1 flagellar hook-basal body complex protein FliE [Leptospira harrisiae]PKA08712.1 flagellar hook-basal body complex protein FliE [Leptospira harrisiae]
MSIDRISNISSQTYKPYSLLPQGDKVGIFRSDERHYGKTNEAKSPDEVAGTFGDALKKAFEQVNDQQTEADELTQKIVFDPNSVELHDVMIAAEKARISLTFAKTMSDGFVRAYRELTTLR